MQVRIFNARVFEGEEELSKIAVLEEMNEKNLKSVEGVGEKKIEKYGEKLLELYEKREESNTKNN